MKIIIAITLFAAVLSGCIKAPIVQAPPNVNIDTNPTTTEPVACTKEARICPDGSAVGRVGPNCEFAPCPIIEGNTCAQGACSPSSGADAAVPYQAIPPVAEFLQRITKKKFGTYITPATSPVQPERFSGYHTGVDVEYEDVSGDVPVVAIANGTVESSGTASGYGGVLAISHTINDEKYVVVYGHLDVATIPKKGATISAGQRVGMLGDGGTKETDGERKHLHLSIHKGTSVVFLGYSKTKDGLDDWIDPVSLYK
jgi:murein DD-endopeptidase MepM/ murein hydrolase activator NlpD